ncbi:MAG TPA: methylaspartate mutase subunit E [Pyrinomonadaceae bacterium]|jgi:methylaspartate mutase epsilon subunit|nr:methylaspartate mutase subunit E [Pyrinomonadaceae bacterium]
MSNSQNGNGKKTSILLGGVGGDSHSVGLTILRQSLLMKNYEVRYLGTQNSLEDFFQFSSLCNAVMISSMDGHTRYYLKDFPELMKKYQAHRPLWYLGGNLHIGDAAGYEQYFLEMGFDRVFVKFTDINTVLELLERDFRNVEEMPDCSTIWSLSQSVNTHLAAPVTDELLDLTTFETTRAEVLEQWSTGQRAKDLDENAEFLHPQPSFPKTQMAAAAKGLIPLVQPRCGVPLICEQINLFQSLKRGGADVLSYQVDSLTRNNNYVGVEAAIAESRLTKTATINGFPIVNHGVDGLRRIISEVKTPLQARHSTRDPRLLAEISYAGGITAFEGGAICYNIPYYKNYPLDESINKWQYVDRLTGLYFKRYGITLDREFFGTLTATLIPPSLAIIVNILEGILAITQGVKCLSLGYAEQGHRIQDVAAIRMLGKLSSEVFENLGYHDIQVNTIFHQYMAAFPDDEGRAAKLIYESAITAALSGATRLIAKTPIEAYRIPTTEDNVQGLQLVISGIKAAAEKTINEERVNEECDIIRREVNAMLDSVVRLGNGCIAEGIVKAFRAGYLDIPFSPSIYNHGEVVTARDAEGAVRFLTTGKIQFDREVTEFHRQRMQERRRLEGLRSEKENYLLVEKDVMQIMRGQYEAWPLFS